jgi:Flp pilus assembly protein TadD
MLKDLFALGCIVLAAVRPAAASEQWTEVSSSHFVVLTDAGPKEGRHLLDQFERMRWLFKTLFPKIDADPPAPIQVYAVRNKKEFQAVEPAEYLAKGKLNLAGYFLPTPDQNYILLRLDTEEEHPFATVYHEYTHLVLKPAGSWLPIWLNEGLAEFFQNTDIHDKDVVLGQPSRDDLLYLQQTSLIPLPVMFRVDHNSPYYHEEEKGSVFYAEAWALTHYLEITDRLDHKDRLGAYLSLVEHHQDPAVAAAEAFGDLKKLQTSLEYYIRQANYKQFEISSAAAPLDEASYKVRVLTPTQEEAVRGSILMAVGRVQDGQALLTSVLQSDANNTEALDALGMASLRKGDRDGARKWFGQAVKAGTQDYFAYFYYAQMSMYDGNDAEVEENLRTAIRLNPAFSPAYTTLASFEAAHRGNLAEARDLAIKAVQLDPSSLARRFELANILILMKDFKAARTVLETCLKAAGSPGQVSLVKSRIDDLNRMETADAAGTPAFGSGADAVGGSSGVVTVPGSQSSHPVDIVADSAPPLPDGPPTGPHHEIIGTIRNVTCSYPAVLQLRVEGGGKAVALYTSNYFKLEFSAVGFTPTGEMNPCQDLEGRRARIQYAGVVDKTVNGQILAVELRK